MLLTVDIGNTQIAVGLFDGNDLRAHWRIASKSEMTEDELASIFASLFGLSNLDVSAVDDVVIASVVPSLTSAFTEMARRVAGVDPLVIEAGVDIGIPVLYDNPLEVGADRVVNAVAGHELYRGPLIVVDFGTATTFDAISEAGEYLGGAIAPGVLVSAEALFSRAARLSRVDLLPPKAAIGKNTRASVQAGVIWGTAGMVDSLVRRISDEIGGVETVIGTGGLVDMIAPHCETITAIEPRLTLIGLRLVRERNR